jgi:hypothetical protein
VNPSTKCLSYGTVKKNCTFGIFVNKTLKRIFGPETENITGEWRQQHEEELYYYDDQMKGGAIFETYSAHGGIKSGHNILVGNPSAVGIVNT